jgi:hypothetical protein
MTPAEQLIAAEYRAQGYTVLHKGCPDFLICKDGKVAFVEVKCGPDTVKPHQREYHEALRKAGLKVEVVHVEGSYKSRGTPRAPKPLLTPREEIMKNVEQILRSSEGSPAAKLRAVRMKASLLGVPLQSKQRRRDIKRPAAKMLAFLKGNSNGLQSSNFVN